MRSKEFARRLDVSIDTIRRLEKRGLISAQRDWRGHRHFSEADVERAQRALFGRYEGGAPCPPHSTGWLTDAEVARSTECPRCGRLIPPDGTAAPEPPPEAA